MRTAPIMFPAYLFLASTALHAQRPAGPADEPPYIEVTGRSELKVVPDQIFIAITLKERGNGSNKVTVEKQELALKESVKALGIDAANLTLSDVIADYVPKTFRKDEVVATKSYELKVGDAEMVRKVFSELDRLEIEDARIDRVSHSKEIEFRKEQRIKAIQAAKEKADYLLTAIGEKTGAALIVREEHQLDGMPGVQFRGQLYGNISRQEGRFDGEYESMGVSFSKVTITASVYVKFGIAPRGGL